MKPIVIALLLLVLPNAHSSHGRLLRVPAFWAGGKTWRVRYASPLPGKHTFRTECSDTANATLHSVTGEVGVRPYRGDNPAHPGQELPACPLLRLVLEQDARPAGQAGCRRGEGRRQHRSDHRRF
ncbi:MAG: DUF5060 domain-containing protein [Verrucomicrobia bacterium]|nr:DUF5060 domain-containing protein [Verrucomicrobiota bacterium]